MSTSSPAKDTTRLGKSLRDVVDIVRGLPSLVPMSCVLEICLADTGQRWRLTLRKGKTAEPVALSGPETQPSAAENASATAPDCSITYASDYDFVALQSGKLKPMGAFRSGRIRVTGNKAVLWGFAPLLQEAKKRQKKRRQRKKTQQQQQQRVRGPPGDLSSSTSPDRDRNGAAATPSPPGLSGVRCEGVLYKRSAWLRSWRPRYFVLRRNALVYYDMPSASSSSSSTTGAARPATTASAPPVSHGNVAAVDAARQQQQQQQQSTWPRASRAGPRPASATVSRADLSHGHTAGARFSTPVGGISATVTRGALQRSNSSSSSIGSGSRRRRTGGKKSSRGEGAILWEAVLAGAAGLYLSRTQLPRGRWLLDGTKATFVLPATSNTPSSSTAGRRERSATMKARRPTSAPVAASRSRPVAEAEDYNYGFVLTVAGKEKIHLRASSQARCAAWMQAIDDAIHDRPLVSDNVSAAAAAAAAAAAEEPSSTSSSGRSSPPRQRKGRNGAHDQTHGKRRLKVEVGNGSPATGGATPRRGHSPLRRRVPVSDGENGDGDARTRTNTSSGGHENGRDTTGTAANDDSDGDEDDDDDDDDDDESEDDNEELREAVTSLRERVVVLEGELRVVREQADRVRGESTLFSFFALLGGVSVALPLAATLLAAWVCRTIHFPSPLFASTSASGHAGGSSFLDLALVDWHWHHPGITLGPYSTYLPAIPIPIHVTVCLSVRNILGVATLYMLVSALRLIAMPRTALWKRRWRVYGTFLGILLRYKIVDWRVAQLEKAGLTDLVEQLYYDAHVQAAETVCRLSLELKGFWVKLGQYLSSRADVMPTPWILRLKRLQDTLPAVAFPEVRASVEASLAAVVASLAKPHTESSGSGGGGGKVVALRLEDLFESFEETCIASASIAQVHAAVLRPNYAQILRDAAQGKAPSPPPPPPRVPQVMGSAGGVNRAAGLRVAVKVQHASVAATMAQDLVNLGVMTRTLEAVNFRGGRTAPKQQQQQQQGKSKSKSDDAETETDPGFQKASEMILNEWSKATMTELDFVREAESMTQIADNLRRFQRFRPDGEPIVASKQPRGLRPPRCDVGITTVLPPLVTPKLIVMPFVDGVKVTEAAAELGLSLEERTSVMRQIVRAYSAMILVDGVFQCDPHPGNILLRRRPRPGRMATGRKAGAENDEKKGVDVVEEEELCDWQPVLLDFGLCKAIAPSVQQGLAMLVFAATSMNEEMMLKALVRIGIKFKAGTSDAYSSGEHMSGLRYLFRDMLPASEARSEFKRLREERTKTRLAKPKAVRNPIEAWPSDLVFFSRTFVLLRGLSANLGVKLPVLQIMAQYATLSLQEESKRRADGASK